MKTDKTKRVLCFLFAALMTVSALIFDVPQVSAEESLEEMQRQYDALEKGIQENKDKLADVNGQIKDNKTKLNEINGEITTIETQIDLLNDRIDILNDDISDLQDNINITTNDIKKLNDEMKEISKQMDDTNVLMADTKNMLLGRLRENYMAGEASMLEIIFSSNDISSYFARKELMTRVSENDANLIQDLETNIKELSDLKEQLKEQSDKLEKKKTELDGQVKTLTDRQTDLKSSKDVQQKKKDEVDGKYREVQGIINELDQDSEEYKAAIKAQEKQREILEAQIDNYIKEHGSSVGDIPEASYNNDGNLAWPVKGKSTVTAGYPAYSNGSAHWGIDICICDSNGSTRDSSGNSLSYGQPYYAAQGGKVIIAHNDGAWNAGFGNYCVIDHGDGIMTLYAHSKSLVVSEGSIVQKGQKLGYIGDTGNTTGPHLHFEVRVKNADGSVSRVQPLNYVSCPGY